MWNWSWNAQDLSLSFPLSPQLQWCQWPAGEADALCHRAQRAPGLPVGKAGVGNLVGAAGAASYHPAQEQHVCIAITPSTHADLSSVKKNLDAAASLVPSKSHTKCLLGPKLTQSYAGRGILGNVVPA